MTKVGGKQGGGCEAEVGDWGKAGGERKQGRKRKVKIVRKIVNDGEQGNKGLLRQWMLEF